MALDFLRNRRGGHGCPRREECRRSGAGESGGLSPVVTMMETAHSRERNDPCSVARVVLNGTPIGSVLAEAIVLFQSNMFLWIREMEMGLIFLWLRHFSVECCAPCNVAMGWCWKRGSRKR